MIVERRKKQRLRSLLGGRVSFNQKSSTLDCLVRNVSEDGALLVISDSIALPNAFDLDITRHQRSYVARIRWRDGERVGVTFEAPPAGEIVPLDMARRLKHCEQDNARLKSRIQQLTEAG
jgi:hypothetical protein